MGGILLSTIAGAFIGNAQAQQFFGPEPGAEFDQELAGGDGVAPDDQSDAGFDADPGGGDPFGSDFGGGDLGGLDF